NRGNAASRIRAMVCGLPGKKRAARRLMAFQAFIDDSGSGVPVFVLSGYVSSVDWWESFSDEWQALLDEPPKLAYFKMREAASRSGQFAGFKIEQRNKRLEKFIALVNHAAQMSVASVVPMKHYKRILE